jgi:hypothetical protein
MVKATEMAKPFGKRPVEWTRCQQAEEFIKELCKVRNCTLADLVIVRRGGNNAGTYLYEDVPNEFHYWQAYAGFKNYETTCRYDPQDG